VRSGSSETLLMMLAVVRNVVAMTNSSDRYRVRRTARQRLRHRLYCIRPSNRRVLPQRKGRP